MYPIAEAPSSKASWTLAVIAEHGFLSFNNESELLTFKTWEKENFDLAENYFNEENWLILVSEFNKIVKVELGCIIKNDEFDWKFGK